MSNRIEEISYYVDLLLKKDGFYLFHLVAANRAWFGIVIHKSIHIERQFPARWIATLWLKWQMYKIDRSKKKYKKRRS